MGYRSYRSSRNRRMIGGLMLACAALLSACGTPPPEAAGEGGLTREYESLKGTVELPAEPARVIVANRDYAGDVLALGVKPIGVSSSMVFEAPYYKELLDGVEGIGEDGSVSLEKITTLNPDVIFTYQEDAYENLSKIAPTVFIPYGQYDYSERLLEIGTILNKENEAREKLEQFRQKVEAKKKALDGQLQPNSQVAIIEITDKDLYLFGKTYGRGGEILYNQLGLAAPAKVEEATAADGWASISLETIPEFLSDADYLLVGVREAGTGRKKDIEASPLWTALPAVQAGRVYEYDLQAFYFQDVLALEYQLEVLSEFLSSKSK